VVVNWNAGKYLQACVQSLQAAAADAPALLLRVYLVDNASTDDSLAAAMPAHNPPEVIQNSENVGFAAACNQGANAGGAPYILFLNPDATASAETLRGAIDFMNAPENQRVGICGVRLIDEHGHTARSCSRFPTPSRTLTDALGLSRLFPRRFQSQHMHEWPHLESARVDQVIGAFFLIRRSLFAQLGGFDERFFVYFEEVDLSYRVHQLGYSSMFLANLQAFHKGGGSSDNVKARRLFYSLRSRMLYALKHFSTPQALLVVLVTLTLEPLARLAHALVRRSASGVVETFKGCAYTWAWLPRFLLSGKTR
jgi:GT2 family glycosyltransferase